MAIDSRHQTVQTVTLAETKSLKMYKWVIYHSWPDTTSP